MNAPAILTPEARKDLAAILRHTPAKIGEKNR